MSSTQQALALGGPLTGNRRRPSWYGPLLGSELTWAIAFIAPYAAVFFAFAIYPIAYGFWMARDLSLYADLFADRHYYTAVVATLLFVGIGVNLKIFLAFLLSGFFMRRRRWIKALLVVFILPWALAAVPAFISFHWMLIGEEGLINNLVSLVFGVDGPIWFNNRWLSIACNTVAYIWKWLPFWTVIFIAARMAIPQDIYEAADVDGATGIRRFVHITFPLLANVYLVCTLLSTLWTLGDFTTVSFVSGGAPALTSDVLATLSVRYALDLANPALGMAAVVSALPVLIPLVILLMRKLQATEVQL